MADSLEHRRKRLRFRSWHRGMKETDFILGRFANTHVDEFEAADLDLFEALLEQPDPEIFEWVSGRTPVPPALDNRVTRLLVSFTAAV